jgi:hypothetical protein
VEAPNANLVEGSLPIVLPLADKLPDQKGQGAAISISQNSAYSSKIESTNEEVLPDTVLVEPSELIGREICMIMKFHETRCEGFHFQV